MEAVIDTTIDKKTDQSIMDSIKRVWPFLKPYKIKVIGGLLLIALQTFTNVLEPFIFGLFMTEITANVVAMANGVPGAGINYQYLITIILIYLVRGLINQAAAFFANYYLTEAIQAMTFDLRNAITEKINHLPVSYFDQNQTGDILNRLTNDLEAVTNAFQQTVREITNAILQLLFVIIMMLIIQWQFALIMIAVIPLTGFIAKFMISKSLPHFKDQANVLGRINGYVQENLSGFSEIKLYGRESNSVDQFEEIAEDLNQVGFRASFTTGLIRPLITIVSHFAYVIIALVGGAMVIAGTLTVGNLQAFAQYVWQVNQPMQILSELSGLVQSASAAIGRVFDMLDEPEEIQKEAVPATRPVEGRVSFNNVSFSYTPTKPLIQDFDVDVEPGKMVAIVGPTGAGKTTMINLLMRFYDVNQGSINVDGQDIRDIYRQDHRKRFGMVLQDTWLFEGTIKENLRFGNLDATDEEIVEAAKIANVDHYIRTLPGGYDSVMNQEASNISQGQKQLLTIARALLSDPKILILDEATSSVDTRLEYLIQQAMEKLMEGRTSFVIAHRLSTIQDADLILVMDQGQIIEQGTHEELLEKDGFYNSLYQSQFAK